MNLESHATVIVNGSEFYYGVVVERDEARIELKLESGEVYSFTLSSIIGGAVDTVDHDDEDAVVNVERL